MDHHDRLIEGLGGAAGGLEAAAAAGAAKGLVEDVHGFAASDSAGLGGGAAGGGGLHELRDAHEQLHRHHMHMGSSGRHSSGTGLIWLLVFLHLGFIGYWIFVYYKQQRNKAAAGKKEPERVHCVYEFGLPTLGLKELGAATKGLGLGVGQEKIP